LFFKFFILARGSPFLNFFFMQEQSPPAPFIFPQKSVSQPFHPRLEGGVWGWGPFAPLPPCFNVPRGCVVLVRRLLPPANEIQEACFPPRWCGGGGRWARAGPSPFGIKAPARPQTVGQKLWFFPPALKGKAQTENWSRSALQTSNGPPPPPPPQAD